ncbi:acyl-CoA dehydrogenase family protein [Conexibacter stalactiti]|uniref:Acyl-CoA dehydrogenase family protein n=1 Tax=Conexibacter stalactiti TaxID=1940611 RepID=A0ABU4HS21_9ACTN|nr:acyl-CoA dehydrogenase family protein [Conexibacter stalactiti]MDW5594859.1 acyl-CoA dehydrogenase family protein [Conexibacter stalactiti]MEC5035501.1 acyl-CoA dehydrogenase family protein [Conexibacter stalactiti]
MDFDDTPEEAEFRARAAAWLDANLTDVPEQEGLDQERREEWSRLWQQRLSDGGWTGLTWPVEHGGHGKEVVFEAIFNEECAKRRTPYAQNGVALLLAGPTIMAHGTPAQKERYLGRILRSEEYWCQGFSEPDAGSDLASLRTMAKKTDGGWLISGEKVWTSNAHNATKCMLLARTDREAPKHKGITYFLADMEQIDVRPLVMTNGDAEFNQMYLDDVFVSDDDVLGEVNDGWKVTLTTLAYERGGLALSLCVWARQAVDAVVEAARTRGLLDDPGVADAVGALDADAEALRIGSLRAMSEASPGPETSVGKLLWARTVQDATRLGLELMGPAAPLVDEPQAISLLHHYLRSRGHTIEGGTDEVQKSILAERVLALPRSR